MVGDGELRDQVEEMIHKFDLDSSFLITGWVDNPTAYMKVMDVGCLLSRWEGFGLVLPEYMACGVPIVATNVDAIPNIIHDGINGILVDKDNIQLIARVIEKIVINTEFRQDVTKKELQIVAEKYDAKRVWNETNNMYQLLLG